MTDKSKFTFIDQICLGFDQALRALTDNVVTTGAVYPAHKVNHVELTDNEIKHAASLMRINHAGEICAQALYHGQAFLSRNKAVHTKMRQAAMEEGDHLHWCRLRIDELGSHTSYLNPLWYAGSFMIGMAAAAAGDEWSLGFVAETETQVIKHLQKHLKTLPIRDDRSHSILQKMQEDENKHKQDAIISGARELPSFIKKIMGLTSKIMVKTTYYI